DVHRVGGRGDHLDADAGQAVDDAPHRRLVAGDRGGGEDDGVVLGELDVLVLPHRHEAEGRERFALGTGADDDDLGAGILAGLVHRDQDMGRHVEIAEVGGDLDVAHHAAADQGHHAAGVPGGVEDRLDTVDV